MRNFLCCLLIAVTILTATGCAYFFPAEEEILAPPLIEPEPIAFVTQEAVRGDIVDKKSVVANFAPLLTAAMEFEGQGGRVTQIHVKMGQEVKKGDLLIELESEPIRRQIRQQEMEVQKARMNLETLQGTREEYDLTALEQARIDLEIQKNQLEYLTVDAETALREWKPNREDLARARDQQVLTIEKTELTIKRLEEEYQQWQDAQEGTYSSARQTQIDVARLELSRQQLALDNLRTDLDRMILYAPMDGVITYAKPTEIGQIIPGYTVVFRISDPTGLLLTYRGDQMSIFYAGMEVDILYKSQWYTGSVVSDSIAQTGEEEKIVTFLCEDIPYNTVGMGDSATVEVVLREAKNVIVLPKNTVNNFMGNKYVNVLVDGVKVEKPVQVGIETATQVEIVSGVEEGEMVIQ